MARGSILSGVGAAAGVMAVMMLFETYKDVLLPKIWKAGALLLVLSICAALAVYVSTSTVPVVIFFVSSMHIIAAYLAYMTCTNKKGDLVLKRHIKSFDTNMQRLQAAEDRLTGALQAMHLADADMHKLQSEIEDAQERARQELDDIQDLYERSMEGSRRVLLTEIAEIANIKGDRKFDESERQRLLSMIRSMAGLDGDAGDAGAPDARLARLARDARSTERRMTRTKSS